MTPPRNNPQVLEERSDDDIQEGEREKVYFSLMGNLRLVTAVSEILANEGGEGVLSKVDLSVSAGGDNNKLIVEAGGVQTLGEAVRQFQYIVKCARREVRKTIRGRQQAKRILTAKLPA